MEMILCSREEESSTLAHGLVLCTSEEAEDYLMHYRTKGSKNGQRRWQDEQGRLTPEGYQHYAEMYGWGKKLKKAQKLQDKADREADKVKAAESKRDKALVKNAKHHTLASAENAAMTKENAEIAKAKANLAQEKASKYADKLERKEEREAKYRNEDGTLTKEALEKYTYGTANPGKRKMSLVGRIKFGNEYSDKFEKEHPGMTKDAYKKWNKNEMEKYDQFLDEEKRGRELNKASKDFDKLSPEEQKKTGDEILKYCKEQTDEMTRILKRDEDLDPSDYHEYNKLSAWVTDRVYKKSGSWNAGSFKQGSEAAKVYPKMEQTIDKMSERENQIKKEIGYHLLSADPKTNWLSADPKTDWPKTFQHNKSERERLYKAFRSDAAWKSLEEAYKNNENDLCGAILKDIGFSDTPENRSIIWQFAYID